MSDQDQDRGAPRGEPAGDRPEAGAGRSKGPDGGESRAPREPNGRSEGRGRRRGRGRGRGGGQRDERQSGQAGKGDERSARPPAERNDGSLVVYLARSGVGSRRTCDELIQAGHVAINGAGVTFPREKVPDGAEVTVDGEVVTPHEFRYLLVNKPRGVASTRSDPHAERVIVDMVADGRTLFPVGRLDVETTGIIILTNDGVLANRLMHPRYGVSKSYVARVRGKVGKRQLADLRDGMELEDGRTSPAEVRVEKQAQRSAVVEITIHEGRKRQVRRMFAALGLPVEELHRRRYGPLSDKGLKIGQSRQLSGDEVDALRRAGEAVTGKVDAEPPEEGLELAPPST